MRGNQLSFSSGDPVTHIKLKKDGVIDQVLPKNRYKVVIGSLTLTCKEEELKSSERKESQSNSKKVRRQVRPQKAPSHKVPEFDFHGHTVEEATNRVAELVNKAIMNGDARIHLVHGHGTGKVKQAVHNALERLDVVKSFEISRSNSGVTVVYL